MHRAALGLGSDLGNRLGYLRGAVEIMTQEGLCVVERSSVYETPPWGVEDLPRFLNACVIAETDMPPKDVLKTIKNIERRLGRTSTGHWSARTIDIDILLYDDLIMNERDLVIPHVFMHERAFVLVPLAEIEPDIKHASSGMSAVSLLKDIPPRELEGIVRVVEL